MLFLLFGHILHSKSPFLEKLGRQSPHTIPKYPSSHIPVGLRGSPYKQESGRGHATKSEEMLFERQYPLCGYTILLPLQIALASHTIQSVSFVGGS